MKPNSSLSICLPNLLMFSLSLGMDFYKTGDLSTNRVLNAYFCTYIRNIYYFMLVDIYISCYLLFNKHKTNFMIIPCLFILDKLFWITSPFIVSAYMVSDTINMQNAHIMSHCGPFSAPLISMSKI